jgi:hypothetical protein
MSDVSCVIFYAGKILQTIEFPEVALNINLFEGPLLSSNSAVISTTVVNFILSKLLLLLLLFLNISQKTDFF